MKKIVKLTENDLTRLVKRVINEETSEKLNLQFDIKEINNLMFVSKQYICKIQKKTLDNTPNVCDTHEQ